MSVTRVHHLNCGTLRPLGRQIPGLMPDDLVAHCLLLERPDGLTLVDTGIGVGDVQERGARLGRSFMVLVGPVLDQAETAYAQVAARGFSPTDVTDIVLTHLDPDHSGGLADFPHATVHVGRVEHDAAMHPVIREKLRYLPAHWSHGPHWQVHDPGGESWEGFESVKVLGDDVLLIPLIGHTRGHSGVAVRKGDGWLLHAGDAFFHHHDLSRTRRTPPGLIAFQRAQSMVQPARLENLERLRELNERASGTITVFCAHNREQFDRLARA